MGIPTRFYQFVGHLYIRCELINAHKVTLGYNFSKLGIKYKTTFHYVDGEQDSDKKVDDADLKAGALWQITLCHFKGTERLCVL